MNSTPLVTETKTYFKINILEIERFIYQETGHKYNIINNEDDPDALFWVYPLNKKYDWSEGLLEKKIKEWTEFKNTGIGSNKLQIILDGLCSEGKIPEGEYLIE